MTPIGWLGRKTSTQNKTNTRDKYDKICLRITFSRCFRSWTFFWALGHSWVLVFKTDQHTLVNDHGLKTLVESITTGISSEQQKALWIKISVDNFLKYVSYFFPENRIDISCKLSPVETICLKCLILFSGKNKKNIINLSSAEIAQRVVKSKMNC